MYVTVSRCWNILSLTGTDFDIDVGIDLDVCHCFQVLKYTQSDWNRLWHWCWHWLRCMSLFPGVEIFSVFRLWHWCWHWLRCMSLFPGVEIYSVWLEATLTLTHCFQVLTDWNRLWHWCWHWLRCTSLFPGVEIFSVWLEPTLTLMLALTLMYVTVSRCWNILCLTGTDFDIDVGIDFDVRHCFQVLKYAQSDWKRLWHWCWHWLRCTSLFPGVEIFSVWLEPTLTLMLALT